MHKQVPKQKKLIRIHIIQFYENFKKKSLAQGRTGQITFKPMIFIC